MFDIIFLKSMNKEWSGNKEEKVCILQKILCYQEQ